MCVEGDVGTAGDTFLFWPLTMVSPGGVGGGSLRERSPSRNFWQNYSDVVGGCLARIQGHFRVQVRDLGEWRPGTCRKRRCAPCGTIPKVPNQFFEKKNPRNQKKSLKLYNSVMLSMLRGWGYNLHTPHPPPPRVCVGQEPLGSLPEFEHP